MSIQDMIDQGTGKMTRDGEIFTRGILAMVEQDPKECEAVVRELAALYLDEDLDTQECKCRKVIEAASRLGWCEVLMRIWCHVYGQDTVLEGALCAREAVVELIQRRQQQ